VDLTKDLLDLQEATARMIHMAFVGALSYEDYIELRGNGLVANASQEVQEGVQGSWG